MVQINGACSGTIVSERHVITAAHCAPDTGWSTATFKWRIGDGTYEQDQFNIYDYRHEDYNGLGDAGDDIALIYMGDSVANSPITGNKYTWYWPSAASTTKMRMWMGDVENGDVPGVAGEVEAPQPLYLQDHNDTVSYRNIWWTHK